MLTSPRQVRLLVLASIVWVVVHPRYEAHADEPRPIFTQEVWGSVWGGPRYRLELFDDGRLVYERIGCVVIKDRRERKVGPRVRAAVRAAFRKHGFLGLDVSVCGARKSCQATVTTTFFFGSRSRAIRHYHGCTAMPPEIRRLEHDLFTLLRVEQWIGSVADRISLCTGDPLQGLNL